MNSYLIFETEHFTIKQTDGYRIPGYLIVESKAEQTRVAEFSHDQAADLVKCLADAEALVQALTAPERIYIMKFGEQNPRVHFHVFPRTKQIAAAYTAEIQDQAPYNGARLVDWIWNRHESLGFSDEEIHHFIDLARKLAQERHA